MWSQRNVGWAQAALLFGVCGAASSRLVNPEGGGTWAEWGFYLFPIPFGVVAAWLYVGRIVPGIALVILDAAVWQLAYRLAVYRPPISMVVTPAPGICLAGLVGGLGVSLATALCKRQAPGMRNVGLGALTGAVCSLPFVWWVIAGDQLPIPEWAFWTLCFAIWQAAVGVCLWRGFGAGYEIEPQAGR
jgi:hypothetical protein